MVEVYLVRGCAPLALYNFKKSNHEMHKSAYQYSINFCAVDLYVVASVLVRLYDI